MGIDSRKKVVNRGDCRKGATPVLTFPVKRKGALQNSP